MHSSEASALLKAHAVLGTVLVADQWLKSHPRTGRTRILLVDSIERGDETKALLARIEEAGKNVPRRRRGWTTVYDWRVLRHVSILEDQSVDNKYYDGFHSPWRRWYCGIV
ncbi:hypothetical protein CDD83_9192 [Cordyceps sp. RAO-2017]|nr:hypothetical protein CDD83_9192 [Cordyceps sp. RAO-2017]